MKRTLCMILALVSLLFCFAACGDKEKESEKLFAFKKDAVEIAIDADAAPILAALGTYQAYDATPSCAFAGEDKVYVYSGFKLQTYQKKAGGPDFVHSVILTDDTYATAEGIAVGAEAARVLEVYGTPDEKTDARISYSTRRETLLFLTRDGRVTSIQYLKPEA